VDSLLKAVEATNIFESEMARRFEGAAAAERHPSSSEEAEAGGGGEGGGGGGAHADDSSPASRVRQRYEKLARERQRVPEHESPERRKEQVGWCGWRVGQQGQYEAVLLQPASRVWRWLAAASSGACSKV
jgi:hypothetical protein